MPSPAPGDGVIAGLGGCASRRASRGPWRRRSSRGRACGPGRWPVPPPRRARGPWRWPGGPGTGGDVLERFGELAAGASGAGWSAGTRFLPVLGSFPGRPSGPPGSGSGRSSGQGKVPAVRRGVSPLDGRGCLPAGGRRAWGSLIVTTCAGDSTASDPHPPSEGGPLPAQCVDPLWWCIGPRGARTEVQPQASVRPHPCVGGSGARRRGGQAAPTMPRRSAARPGRPGAGGQQRHPLVRLLAHPAAHDDQVRPQPASRTSR